MMTSWQTVPAGVLPPIDMMTKKRDKEEMEAITQGTWPKGGRHLHLGLSALILSPWVEQGRVRGKGMTHSVIPPERKQSIQSLGLSLFEPNVWLVKYFLGPCLLRLAV